MIKAVIFDMDGVIIDSEMAYLQMDLEFARTKNPNVKLEQLFGMVGSSREDAWGCMARAIGNGQSWEEVRDEFKASVNAYAAMDYRAIYRPGVTAVLQQLTEAGYKIALASSTQMEIIRRVLIENEIEEYFDVVVSGNQFKRSKPDPEIYHYTAQQLGVREEECFVIEDSTFGVTAASRAGMKIAAMVDERFGFDQSKADYLIREIEDILPLIFDGN
jgi:haloacid dehalogenase superfamily, subfamily IA, variant 3 with third motif having DD or ED/haloacid dehalogenase superfamily, subfamily IA, variant 1 with third motif having Dx(3-4)D or Dx(3-4)E